MKIRFFSFLSLFQHGIRAKEENLILSCFSVSSTPGNLPVTVFLSGHRVSFRSPFPSPNTFRSVGSSLETTHRRRNFPANFPATYFSDTDHTRRSAWRRSPPFVKTPAPKEEPRAVHARFSVGGCISRAGAWGRVRHIPATSDTSPGSSGAVLAF